jgi:hypothetical protein
MFLHSPKTFSQNILLCIAFLFFVSSSPAVAANLCCACKGPPDPTKITCLQTDAGKLKSTDCSQLKTALNLPDPWICDAVPLDTATACIPISSGKGTAKCALGPTDAITLISDAAQSAPSGKTGTGDPALVPELGVRIPGLTFGTDGAAFFGQYVSAFYRFLISIAAIAATVMFVFGAFMYLVGTGIHLPKYGKSVMKDAVIGLILVLLCTMLLRTINPATTNLSFINLKPIVGQEFIMPTLEEAEAASKKSDELAAKQTGSANDASDRPINTPREAGGGAGCNAGPSAIFPLKVSGAGSATYASDKSLIIVPHKVLNCPGAYPALLWLHGNNAPGAKPSYVDQFSTLLANAVNNGSAQPLIIVMPVSAGKDSALFPNMTWQMLRDDALATLRNIDATKNVQFSTISVGGHSGAGCSVPWRTVNTIAPYAILNADTCFGFNAEVKHDPTKMIVLVATMNDRRNYKETAKTLKLQEVSSDCKSPWPLSQNTPNCFRRADKDWNMFYIWGRKHGMAPGNALEYALRHFFQLANRPES